MGRNAFDSVTSVFKRKSSEESGSRLAFEYETYEKSKEEEYRSFEGKRRGGRH
ncbi:hypothetical protein [Pseudonocardia xishanensis]|uniref:Uncharacterized protein n=1 Tax=Pseudonocardia xishanensis TaxID=630995 RepID=A0ABP8RXU3_9PSEU